MQGRVLIATGGTGGHVLPAQILAEELIEKGCSVHFIGAQLSTNPYFDRTRWSYQDVDSATISLREFSKVPKGIQKLMQGVRQAKNEIKKSNPNVIVGFGSYHSLPPLIAGSYLRVPLVLHEANSCPGRVTRLMAPFAHLIGVHFPEAIVKLNHLGRKSALEIPLPKKNRHVCREEAFAYFGFSAHHPTLLIFGGSQGAEKINEAIPHLLKGKIVNYQVLHFIGYQTQPEALERFYRDEGAKALIKPFEPRIDLAWEIADLYIGRSGANSVAEMVDYAVPGILIPYPQAVDGHQDENARSVARRLQGAILLPQKELLSQNAPESFDALLAAKERFHQNLLKEKGRKQLSLCDHLIKIISRNSYGNSAS